MKFLILLTSFLILASSCVKPSYKKNEIVTSSSSESESETGFFEESANQKLTADQQIASALMAVPSEMREGAQVYGYGESGEFMTLREGTNAVSYTHLTLPTIYSV